MLTVILYRIQKGHFTADNHFGFEGVAWYWHFVDVVWLGLFISSFIIGISDLFVIFQILYQPLVMCLLFFRFYLSH
jgi:hypothetical protein